MHIFLGNYKMIQINNKQKQQGNKSDTHTKYGIQERMDLTPENSKRKFQDDSCAGSLKSNSPDGSRMESSGREVFRRKS